MELVGDALQAREEEDDRESDVLPRDDDEERVEDEAEIGEPELNEPAEPHAAQDLVDEPVGLEQLEEDDGRDRLGEDVRAKKISTEQACALASGG